MARKSSSMDRSLWPVGVETAGKAVSRPVETAGNSVAIDICELVVLAFTRHGYDDQNAAAILGMSKSTFSKCFRDANQEHANNGAMKRLRQIPFEVMREFAGLLAAKVGLSVGVESERAAVALDLANNIERLMRVGGAR